MIFENISNHSRGYALEWDYINIKHIHSNVTDERNHNLTKPQEEFMLVHNILLHINEQWCQKLTKERKYEDEYGRVTKLARIIKSKHKHTSYLLGKPK